VMGHIQHLFFESLVKMDHFQKEPPLNLKGDHWVKGIGNPALYPRKRTWACQLRATGSAPWISHTFETFYKIFADSWVRTQSGNFGPTPPSSSFF
jgi:hypothetical protein